MFWLKYLYKITIINRSLTVLIFTIAHVYIFMPQRKVPLIIQTIVFILLFIQVFRQANLLLFILITESLLISFPEDNKTLRFSSLISKISPLKLEQTWRFITPTLINDIQKNKLFIYYTYNCSNTTAYNINIINSSFCTFIIILPCINFIIIVYIYVVL